MQIYLQYRSFFIRNLAPAKKRVLQICGAYLKDREAVSTSLLDYTLDIFLSLFGASQEWYFL